MDSAAHAPGHVFKHNEAVYLDRGNGVRSLPLAGPESGTDQILSGITEVPPHGEIPLHHHNTDEFVMVLSGRAVVTVDGVQTEVKAMDSTLVRRGVQHRYANAGETPLTILWVYGDIETTRTIASTGITMGHLDKYGAV